MTSPSSPQDIQLPPAPGLDNPFGSSGLNNMFDQSCSAQQTRDHGGSPLYTPKLSFDMMDATSPVNSQGLQEEPSHSYLGATIMTIHHSYMPVNLPMASQLAEDGARHLWRTIKYILYSVPCSRTNIKHLSEVKGNMQEKLSSITEENQALVVCLNAVEQIVDELQERGEQRLIASRMNSNHHASIIQLLYFQLCGIECDGTKANYVAALVAVKPLENKQPFKLLTEGLQIWHPNWLGKVDDELNAEFIKEVGNHVFNNEKSQGENIQLKTIPDKSFNLATITDCRAKELYSNQGIYKVKARLEQGHQQAQHVIVAVAQHKVALQYKKESSNQGTAALILTDFRSDILTCEDNEASENTLQQRKDAEVGQSTNKVVGHAWRSINHVAFLCWLSLCAMTQQQHTTEELSVDQEPQHKWHRTTKKQHKRVFNIALKHLNHDKLSTNGMIFKVMVNKRWYDQHPDTVIHEGINWLKGFYSYINQSELFKANTMYLS
ncbi:hypothetical protein V8B97DRAFT_2027069 [Scleroderma yunnanense]